MAFAEAHRLAARGRLRGRRAVCDQAHRAGDTSARQFHRVSRALRRAGSACRRGSRPTARPPPSHRSERSRVSVAAPGSSAGSRGASRWRQCRRCRRSADPGCRSAGSSSRSPRRCCSSSHPSSSVPAVFGQLGEATELAEYRQSPRQRRSVSRTTARGAACTKEKQRERTDTDEGERIDVAGLDGALVGLTSEQLDELGFAGRGPACFARETRAGTTRCWSGTAWSRRSPRLSSSRPRPPTSLRLSGSRVTTSCC